MTCLYRVCCFFFGVSVLASLSAAFQWKSREFLYVTGCARSNVTIPWHFQADIGEAIETIYWTHGPKHLMASLYKKTFNSEKTYMAKVNSSPLHEAALQMSGLQVSDTGYYSVQVTVNRRINKLPEVTYNSSALLTVSEAPEISGGSLEVTEVTSPDPCAQRRQRTLSCGTFFNRGFPPVDIMWTDPVGQLLPSTRFQNNRFDLDLPMRPLLGNYSCRLNCQAAVSSCLSPGAPLLGLYLLSPLADDGCPWREGEVAPLPGYPEEEQGEKTATVGSDVLGVARLYQNVTDVQEAVQSLQDQLLQAASREKEREAVVQSLKTQLEELRGFIVAGQRATPSTITSLPAFTPRSAALEVEKRQMRDNLTQLLDAMQLVQRQVAGQGDDLRTLRTDLKQSQHQMAGLDDNLQTLKADLNQARDQIGDQNDELRTFTADLEQTQQQMASQEDNQRTLRADLNQTQDRHQKDLAGLLAIVKVMEERQLTVTPMPTPTLTTPLLWASDSQAELSDLSLALTNLSERMDKQCSLVSVHSQADLTLLEARLGSLDRKVRALHPGTPVPAEIDPLVSTLRPTFALRSPSTTDAVVRDFAFTRDGQVLLALDRIVLTRNISTSDFISRPLKHGTILRCVTALEDGRLVATVDDGYIVMLDAAALDSEDSWEGERWLATDSLYYGIAARSPQTLYASVIKEDSADLKARIDVITITEDQTVVITTLLTNDVTKELISPRGLTLHQDALYVSDWDSNVIVRYDLNSREASIIAGPPSLPQLNFYQPRHTAFDVTGNMYVTTGGSVCGGRDLYSEGFCVLVIAREGPLRRLVRLGPHVYPYGIAITPTGLAVSWASYVSSQPQSLLQWYDYVLPAHTHDGNDLAVLQGHPVP